MDNPDLWFAMAVVATILAAVVLVQTRAASLLAWSATVGFAALCLAWWP